MLATIANMKTLIQTVCLYLFWQATKTYSTMSILVQKLRPCIQDLSLDTVVDMYMPKGTVSQAAALLFFNFDVF